MVLPTRKVFRPEDPPITILRLAAAANDLATLLRLVEGAYRRKKWTTAERFAAYRYGIRMAALHLNAIKKIVKHDLPEVEQGLSKRRGSGTLATLSAQLRERMREPRISQVVATARHGFAGHYDAQQFIDALQLLEPDELMEIPGRGVHHNVCDRPFDVLFAHVSHREFAREDVPDSVKAALDAVFDIQKVLFPLVQGLVVAISKEGLGM